MCVCCLVRVNYYEIREGAHGKTAGAGVESGQEVRNIWLRMTMSQSIKSATSLPVVNEYCFK